MRKVVFVAAVIAALGAAWPSGAAQLLTDSFNYADGALVSVSGGAWVHHSGTITGEVQVVSGRAFIAQTNSEDVSTLLPGQPYIAASNTVLYASFTVNFRSLPSGSFGSYFAHFKDSGTGFRSKVYAFTNGAAPGAVRIGLANADNSLPSATLATDLNLNTDYLLVMRYVLSNATSTVWVQPVAESDPGLAASDTATTINVISFALRESLSSGNGMGSLFFDNLLVGTSFADVLPNVPPGIDLQPQSQTVIEGTDVLLTVNASGSQPLTYQWQFYGTNLDGATDASLLLTGVTTNQSGPYSVSITNAFGHTNSDSALLTVNPQPPSAPIITFEPQSQSVGEGTDAVLSVGVTGSATLTFQWQFYGTNLPDATNTILLLTNVALNQAGPYQVTVTNNLGGTNSDVAVLTVLPAVVPALTVLTYNVKGNGAGDWSTNAAQVQAIGHEVMYLNPDIITFNEIPFSQTYQMTNFVTAFLPGYHLATNSATDGFIRSVVASRFPIIYSQSYLHSSDLAPYGYTNSNFTRDLFEAEIAVPGFAQPLDVFVVHLKSGQTTDESAKRAAEASAVSNFFVTTFLSTNVFHPYYLAGDMNEDINDPPPSNPQSIQRLVNGATGLHLTTPVNPVTGTRLTFSIQNTNGLTKRYDYIQPSGLLYSNISASEVFRSDLLVNPPLPLMTNDDRVASDHLPVRMSFGNPYAQPFRLLSIERTNQILVLKWESVPGQSYHIQSSSNLLAWSLFASNLIASNWSFLFVGNISEARQFFRIAKGP